MAALAADERVHALVQGVVDDANRERSRFEQVKRFAILPRDFTMEAGEITPTLKLRRRAVQEHFADGDRGAVRRAARRALRDDEIAGERLEPAGADEGARSARRGSRSSTTSPVCGAWTNWPPPM